jgi:hypothetical protein
LERGITPEADLPVPLEDDPLFPHERRTLRRVLFAASVVLGFVLAVILLSYGWNLPGITLGFILLVVVLVVGARWLTESGLRSPGGCLVAALVITVLLWVGIAGGPVVTRAYHVDRYLPQAAIDALRAAEEGGWVLRTAVPVNAPDSAPASTPGPSPGPTLQKARSGAASPGAVAAPAAQAPERAVVIAVAPPQLEWRVGQPVFLTAVLTYSPSGPAVAGTVEFFDGSVSMGSAPIDRPGAAGVAVATLTTRAPAVGPHTFTARYSDPRGSFTSAPTTVTVAAQ